MQGVVLGIPLGKIGRERIVVNRGVDQRGQVKALRGKVGWDIPQQSQQKAPVDV